MNTFENISSLSNLLNPKQATPGSIGPPKTTVQPIQKPQKPKPESKDIWDEDEIEEVEYSDPRPQPEYTISYSQNVSSEDMYLGMNGKTPSFSHADAIQVTISLPNTLLKDIQVHCKKLELEVACPK